MLQGSLDNFALDEVLSLLSTTQKTGHLALSGDRGTGSLWLETGEIVGTAASNLEEASPSDDVMFELLRFESGSFLFTMDDRLDAPGVAESVDLLLGTAKDRIVEWRTIEAVVPSLSHELWLIKSLEADDVLLSRRDWDAVVAVGEGNSVGNTCELLQVGEVDGSRMIKGLIERGVLTIGETSEIASEPASSTRLFAPPVETAHPESDFAPDVAQSTFTGSTFAESPVAESSPVAPVEDFEFLDHGALDHDAIGGIGAQDAPRFEAEPVDHVDAMFANEPVENSSFGASLADAGVSTDELFSGVDATEAPVHDDFAPQDPPAAPDVEAPAFEAAVPTFEAPAVPFEAPAPGFDTPAPAFETPAAPYEAPAPAFEAPAVPFEAPAPGFDTPAPAFEAPSADSAAPAFDDQPAFETPPAFGDAPEMPDRPPMPAPPSIGADGSIQVPPPPPPPAAAAAFAELAELEEGNEEASLLMRYLKTDSH